MQNIYEINLIRKPITASLTDQIKYFAFLVKSFRKFIPENPCSLACGLLKLKKFLQKYLNDLSGFPFIRNSSNSWSEKFSGEFY